MALTDPDLWRRLETFEVGARTAAFGFVDRLARENGWSTALAHEVVSEYRRFVYLCAVAGRPPDGGPGQAMTPSEAVDQAWHLHLTYSRSYWQDLCRDVLGRPLHHEPTAGGPAERAKFERTYARTLAAYAREFGRPPPADIWPDVRTRFAGAGAGRWVVAGANWVVAKHHVRQAFRVAALATLLPLGLLACQLVEVQDDGSWVPTQAGVLLGFLVIGIPVAIAWQIGFLNPKERKNRRPGGGCGGGCSGCGGCGGCSD